MSTQDILRVTKKHQKKRKAETNLTFFANFSKNFIGKNNSDNTLTVNLEEVSNKKYLKLYGIESLLANKNKDILENSLNFSHQKDDLFFGLNTSVYRSIKDDYDDKYEYILPNVTLDKNLFSNNKIGVMDIQSNLQVRNYDTNKTEKFLVNDLSWDIKK